jgi:hypothetical protein
MNHVEPDHSIIDERRLDQPHAELWNCLAPPLCPKIIEPRMAPALRRFACTCCRAVQHHLAERESVEALEAIERFAEGRASFEELVVARNAAKLAARRARPRIPRDRRIVAASEAVCHAGRNHACEAMVLTSRAAERAGLGIRTQAQLFSNAWHDARREAVWRGTSGL